MPISFISRIWFKLNSSMVEFQPKNDDLFLAKILIDWVQSNSISIVCVGQCWIDDFLICNLQFPDFSYNTEMISSRKSIRGIYNFSYERLYYKL